MAKTLKNILDGIKASKVTPGSTGTDPHVDYEPKSGDEQKWIETHNIEKHENRAGNDDKLYAASNIKYSMDDPKMKNFGHKKGKDKEVYGESVNEDLTDEDKKNHLILKHKIASRFLNDPANKNNKGSDFNTSRHLDNEYNARKSLAKMGINVPKPNHRLVEELLDEKLTKDMSAGEVIDDFVHSKDPKFKSKSVKQRQKQALGAYYSMHPEKSKTNENLDIPKNKTDDTEEEISMVKGELKAIANKSMHILTSMSKDMHVEPWVQAKIAQAKELINSVHDYLMYNQEDEQTDGKINFPGMDGNNIGPSSTFPGGGATYNAIGMNV